MKIVRAGIEDAEEILQLQKLAYQDEAKLYNNYGIPPLMQTLDEIRGEFKDNVFLKAVSDGKIAGSVRAYEKDGICYIGRLAVSPVLPASFLRAELPEIVQRSSYRHLPETPSHVRLQKLRVMLID